MKKIGIIIVVLLSVFSFSACNNKQDMFKNKNTPKTTHNTKDETGYWILTEYLSLEKDMVRKDKSIDFEKIEKKEVKNDVKKIVKKKKDDLDKTYLTIKLLKLSKDGRMESDEFSGSFKTKNVSGTYAKNNKEIIYTSKKNEYYQINNGKIIAKSYQFDPSYNYYQSSENTIISIPKPEIIKGEPETTGLVYTRISKKDWVELKKIVDDTELKEIQSEYNSQSTNNTTPSSSSSSSSSTNNDNQGTSEINEELKKYLDVNKGWALGTLNSYGEPTENGSPNPEYKNWVYVKSIIYSDDSVDMQVTADFLSLSTAEKDKLASSAQGMTASIALLDDRPHIYVYNGDNSYGGSKILSANKYKWSK